MKKISVLISVIILVLASKTNAADYCEIGAFVGNEDHRAPYASEVTAFEELAGRHLNTIMVYWAWNDGDFPAVGLNNGVRYHDGYDTKTVLQLTWEPWSRLGGDDSTYSLADIINGVHDTYIAQFAQDCKSWRDPIHLRFMHEMIGIEGCDNWYPWQDKPADYIETFNHVCRIFKDQAADNVKFVWAPNSYPFDVEVIKEYFPGKENVDWLGLCGHNAGEPGNGPEWPNWAWFDDIFWPLYHAYIDNPDIFGDKPVMLSEFSSVGIGGDKAAWIIDAFERIKSGDYSKIEAFYWFNTDKDGQDWRINSSPESLAAFQLAMTDSYYTSHPIPEPATILLLGGGLLSLCFVCKKRQKTIS